MRVKLLLFTLLIAASFTRAATEQSPWLSLFDGVSLTGWKAAESPQTFTVSKGEIIAHGPRAHLFYVGPREEHEWKNFELEMEVKTAKDTNSGVYFHTRVQESGFPETGYQVQINNTNPYPSKTGSLYGVDDRLTTTVSDDVWFKLWIRVEGKRIITKVNDQLICDYLEPENPARTGDVKGSVLSHGTIALQGHDKDSEVRFRNIRIRPLAQANR